MRDRVSNRCQKSEFGADFHAATNSIEKISHASSAFGGKVQPFFNSGDQAMPRLSNCATDHTWQDASRIVMPFRDSLVRR
jgi:hypothetical protein